MNAQDLNIALYLTLVVFSVVRLVVPSKIIHDLEQANGFLNREKLAQRYIIERLMVAHDCYVHSIGRYICLVIDLRVWTATDWRPDYFKAIDRIANKSLKQQCGTDSHERRNHIS